MSDTAPSAPAAPEAAATPETPPTEAASTGQAAAAAPAEPKAEPLSPKLAALMKQEKALRERETTLKKAEAERETWEKQRAEREALKKSDILKWMESEGVDYATATEMALNGGPPTKEKVADERVAAAEARIAELAAKLEAKEKEAADKEAALREKETAAQVADFWKGARAEVEKEGEKYELVLKHPDGWDTLQAVVSAHARDTGEVMGVAEAAEKVQAALEAQLAPVLSSKWAAGKLAAVAPKQPAQSAESESGPRRAVRTLSNAHAAAPAPPRAPSRDELRAAAIRLLESRERKDS